MFLSHATFITLKKKSIVTQPTKNIDWLKFLGPKIEWSTLIYLPYETHCRNKAALLSNDKIASFSFFYHLFVMSQSVDKTFCLCFCLRWQQWKIIFVEGCKQWAKYSVGWKSLNKNFLSVRYRAPDDRRPPGAVDPSALSQRVPGRRLHLPGCLQTGLMSLDSVTLCDLVRYYDWIGTSYHNLSVHLIATADRALPPPCFLDSKRHCMS